MLSRILTAFVAAFLVLVPLTAEAARVSPMIVDLEPAGRNSIARVELTNDSTRNIPYEVQMMRGDISPDGELSLTPADDQFMVFPAQAIVESRSQQVFRIQYVGEQAMAASQIYYMSIRQVPVEMPDQATQVQVVINYNVLVNVVPDGTQPLPVVSSVALSERTTEVDPDAPQDSPASKPRTLKGIAVDVGNDGNRFFLAGTSDWLIRATTTTGEPFEKSFTGEQISKIIGVGVVAPGKHRRFFVPVDKDLAKGSVSVELKL
ncbi:fimbrial biogenesis chaperone [Novosphingobium pentaromativorans]|uniref:Pili assembly chaperone N-terminal domain-containing protein n=1 Tax=Novosphingobium pentaromativorans US6-1 TaxID=1088721 RepID=G6EKM8_9SPHN|nr:fimbria/pilus periplasmic chaperone [Novosphingobium pentaromativorans]AIT82820.1 hypothetical protein JI59_25620 [Novosphingobium pentaromativorans US6-1]EHJ58149.1 hypothetical protein NSU_4899 [Novosphingobium pentaromativorans US6-1]